MDKHTDTTHRPGRLRRLLTDVAGLFSVLETFDQAVVELFEDEPDEEPQPAVA
jgi:hypothetical protein